MKLACVALLFLVGLAAVFAQDQQTVSFDVCYSFANAKVISANGSAWQYGQGVPPPGSRVVMDGVIMPAGFLQSTFPAPCVDITGAPTQPKKAIGNALLWGVILGDNNDPLSSVNSQIYNLQQSVGGSLLNTQGGSSNSGSSNQNQNQQGAIGTGGDQLMSEGTSSSIRGGLSVRMVSGGTGQFSCVQGGEIREISMGTNPTLGPNYIVTLGVCNNGGEQFTNINATQGAISPPVNQAGNPCVGDTNNCQTQQ